MSPTAMLASSFRALVRSAASAGAPPPGLTRLVALVVALAALGVPCEALPPRAAAQGQQQDPPPLPDLVPGDKSVRRDAWLASDGEPAAPGRIPRDTADAARARFGKLAGRLTSDTPVRSFELRFDLEARTDTGTREVRRTELRYLDDGPGWVYGAFLNPDGSVKQCQMRGPRENGARGYWHVLKDGTVVDLRGGDDFSESRDELDGWAALCHDLLLLQQPGQLRLVRLAARSATPAGEAGIEARTLSFGEGDVVVLPDVDVALVGRRQRLAERARKLEWLEIVTPDIRLWSDGPEVGAVRRILLGIDPDLGVPELALLTQRIEGRLVDASTTLLHLADWRRLGGEGSGAGSPPGGPGGPPGGPTGQPSGKPSGATAGGSWLPQSTRLFELREAEGPERQLAPVVFKNRARLDLFLLPGGKVGGPPPAPSTFRPPDAERREPPR